MACGKRKPRVLGRPIAAPKWGALPGVGKTPFNHLESPAKLSPLRKKKTDQDIPMPSLFSDAVLEKAHRWKCLGNGASLPSKTADSLSRCGTRPDFQFHLRTAAGPLLPNFDISGVARSMISIVQVFTDSVRPTFDSSNDQSTQWIPKAL